MFVIREVDPKDSDNFLMSKSVHSVAKDYGWWDGREKDGLLDFTKVYSDGEYAHKFYSGRRMWGGYHLACPSQDFPSDYVDLQSDPVYPVHARPDRPLSIQDIFRFHRYYYQGTEFDLGAENMLAAGPFGTPDRWKEGQVKSKFPETGSKVLVYIARPIHMWCSLDHLQRRMMVPVMVMELFFGLALPLPMAQSSHHSWFNYQISLNPSGVATSKNSAERVLSGLRASYTTLQT